MAVNFAKLFLGASGRRSAKILSMVKRRGRVHGRHPAWPTILAKKLAATYAMLVMRQRLEPDGFLCFHPRLREHTGGCESADHPRNRPNGRGTGVPATLFGSGSTGLGTSNRKAEGLWAFPFPFPFNGRATPAPSHAERPHAAEVTNAHDQLRLSRPPI